jgi:hypothetical protein
MASTRLTDKEEKIFRLIPVSPRKISLVDLSKLFWETEHVLPDDRKNVNSRITGINIKLNRTKQPWRIEKSPRRGQHSIFCSRVKR